MAKSAKKSDKKVVTKKVAKKVQPAKKAVKAVVDGEMTRAEAADALKISIYAVDQLLLKKQLRDLLPKTVKSYKPAKKAA